MTDYDLPIFDERPDIYERGHQAIQRLPLNTSPPPKEIVSAISLIKDYMVEGSAALGKNKVDCVYDLHFQASELKSKDYFKSI